MAGKPAPVDGQRRRQRQHVRVVGLAQVGQAGLGHDEGAARVDLLHQVEALDRQLAHGGEVDRAGVVDDQVDAAEALDGLLHGGGDDALVADVADDRQRLAAGGLDLLRGGVDRPRQLRMRLSRLGDQGDLGAVAGGPPAIARPIPRLPPDMNMTRPSRLLMRGIYPAVAGARRR